MNKKALVIILIFAALLIVVKSTNSQFSTSQRILSNSISTAANFNPQIDFHSNNTPELDNPSNSQESKISQPDIQTEQHQAPESPISFPVNE